MFPRINPRIATNKTETNAAIAIEFVDFAP